MSQPNPQTHKGNQFSFSAKWTHDMRPDGYCGYQVTEFEIESDNHAFFHLLEYLVERLPGMDQVVLLMADKIVKDKLLKEGNENVTKN